MSKPKIKTKTLAKLDEYQLAILSQALYYHAQDRRNFAGAICQENFKKRNGDKPTKEDIAVAFQYLRETEKLYEKVNKFYIDLKKENNKGVAVL